MEMPNLMLLIIIGIAFIILLAFLVPIAFRPWRRESRNPPE
jgi:hypothetical protein